jgi:hypothetical protein
MLADLRAIATGQTPTYARRAIDVEAAAKMEAESGETVDMEQPQLGPAPSVFSHPVVLLFTIIAAVSILANIGLAVLYVMK